jgi:hypothetical protein
MGSSAMVDSLYSGVFADSDIVVSFLATRARQSLPQM